MSVHDRRKRDVIGNGNWQLKRLIVMLNAAARSQADQKRRKVLRQENDKRSGHPGKAFCAAFRYYTGVVRKTIGSQKYRPSNSSSDRSEPNDDIPACNITLTSPPTIFLLGIYCTDIKLTCTCICISSRAIAASQSHTIKDGQTTYCTINTGKHRTERKQAKKKPEGC